MKISILTMFPEMLDSLKNSPIIQHAQRDGILELEIVDIKEFADGSFRHIDDSPYGGGPGMILRCEPVLKALHSVETEGAHVVIPLPIGATYTEEKAHAYTKLEHLILIAGHYEGLDARVLRYADEFISLGDYVISGGEYACMILVDSVVRLLDGVIKKKSTEDESFENGLLEYPQYTRPVEYEGMKVPDVLLSGNHEKIAEWKKKKALELTYHCRKDLLDTYPLTEEERKYIAELKKEE